MRTLRFSSSGCSVSVRSHRLRGQGHQYLGDSGSGSSGGSSSGTGPVGPTLPLLEGRMRATVTLLSLLLGGCSPTSSGGGSPESADAAVAQACAYLQTAAGNASHSGMCPIAPGGTCLGTSGCDPKSLPTGLACSDQYCIALIDPVRTPRPQRTHGILGVQLRRRPLGLRALRRGRLDMHRGGGNGCGGEYPALEGACRQRASDVTESTPSSERGSAQDGNQFDLINGAEEGAGGEQRRRHSTQRAGRGYNMNIRSPIGSVLPS